MHMEQKAEAYMFSTQTTHSMNKIDVICQRGNTKIEKEKGKRAHPYSYFYNP